jgi:hypothetical protein
MLAAQGVELPYAKFTDQSHLPRWQANAAIEHRMYWLARDAPALTADELLLLALLLAIGGLRAQTGALEPRL